MTIDELIKQHTIAELKRNRWNQARSAEALGVSERTIHAWIKKWRDQGDYIPCSEMRGLTMIKALRAKRVV